MTVNKRELSPISEWTEKLQSQLKAIELFLVLKKAKPCARMLATESQYHEAKRKLSAKVVILSSDFKLITRKTPGSNYSDLSFKVLLNYPKEGKLIIYIAKDGKIAKAAKEADENQDHETLGKLLGYPKCCRDFFKKEFSREQTDLTLATLKNSKEQPFPWQLNVAARHLDAGLISHFPCSFECEESKRQAQEYYKALEEHNQQTAKDLKRHMQTTALYTKNQGIHIIHELPSKERGYVYYDWCISSRNTELGQLLKNSKKITKENKALMINNKELQNLTLLRFN